jgi:hypothetical protein
MDMLMRMIGNLTLAIEEHEREAQFFEDSEKRSKAAKDYANTMAWHCRNAKKELEIILGERQKKEQQT